MRPGSWVSLVVVAPVVDSVLGEEATRKASEMLSRIRSRVLVASNIWPTCGEETVKGGLISEGTR